MTTRRSRARLRVALLGTLILALNAAVFAAFTWPRLTRVRRAESRAQQVAAQKAAAESLSARLRSRKELVARNRADIESLRRDYLKPRAQDLFAAQREIEQLARDSGLRPKRSTYALQKIKGTDLERCEVTLPLDGSYLSLMGFLSRVESAKRFLVVDQMGLSQDEQGASMNLNLWAVFTEGGPHAPR